MSQINSNVAVQFDDAEQQHGAAAFGMWIFLATEIMFFGGMFMAYTVYRFEYPEVFPAASAHLNLWAGGAMTAILLAGSLLVAMCDHLMEYFCKQTTSLSRHRRWEQGSAAQQSLQMLAEEEVSEMQRVIWRRLAITAGMGVA
ncbi:MAG: hypothetical protein ABI557_14490, partial [Aureliella sp.]